MSARALVIAMLATGCAASEAAPPQVRVELASVTLADDCPPPTAPTPAPGGFAVPPPRTALARCAGPQCAQRHQRACEQTAMQLVIEVPRGAAAARFRVVRVELLDERGAVVDQLTARAASRWKQTGSYAPWDERLRGGERVAASYALSAPSWTRLTNGRRLAHGHRFQLRVTVAIGAGEQTVEMQSITPARVAPQIVT